MEYKRYGGRVFIRLDKGDIIVDSIRAVCDRMQIRSATFSGIGACGDVTVATYLPDKGVFLDHHKTGMLEMVSLTGNIVWNNGEKVCHAHVLFSYLDENGEIAFFGGHLKNAHRVLYSGDHTQPRGGWLHRTGEGFSHGHRCLEILLTL